jgi:hypothetical protein
VAMRLYSGSSQQFIEDTCQNRIAQKVRESFLEQMGHYPPESELNAWRNSLRATSMVFQHAKLTDHGVIVEYQLPLTSKRLDCMICGKNGESRDNAVIIELKQWGRCQPAEGEHEVLAWVGGSERELLHPSVQAGQYRMWLEDVQPAFYEEPDGITLSACAYLHNYSSHPDDPLFSSKFQLIVESTPLFTAEDVTKFEQFLVSRLEKGEGLEILKKVEESRYRPSKKLMDHVSNMIRGTPEYILLDDQLIVYDRVLSLVKGGFQDARKTVLIVRGGPGTGKSVIAINLMADLLRKGFNAQYATGSRAFTETLRKVIGPRGGVQFKYFNSYAGADYNAVDVLIADEAHRIRKTSNSRYSRKESRRDVAQIDELIRASKVAVFFIDDDQVVRPDEIGSVAYIREYAEKSGCTVLGYELETQFRCAGSSAFVSWVNNTLGIKETANTMWGRDEAFDFRVVESPEALEELIIQKAGEGFSARMTAGFCWPWSDARPDGTLVDDVVIGGYRRPWNARPEARRLAKGIPKALTWAYDPEGLSQVGCVYTAQGFEFDYAGVIFGKDLVYNPSMRSWDGHPEISYDSVVKRSGQKFLDLVKHTYRVLLTRGMKGCYVHFMDKGTESYVLSRMESG